MSTAKATVVPAKSFAYQDKLPSLPVPDLHQTLTKYLDSVKPHVSEEEFRKTKTIVHEFENGQGRQLHSLLLDRAGQRRNWLEEWWQKEVYLAPRYPIYPLINFGGPAPRAAFPACEGSQIPRAALYAYLTMKFWKLLRNEEYPPHLQRGTPLCMEQLRRLFSTCRIPGEQCDSFEFGFKTVSEGPSPKHIVVICNNRYWKLDIADENEQLYTPPELERAFVEIRKRSDRYVPPLGVLTCLDRPSWAELRQHLIKIDPMNKSSLRAIETSMTVEIRK